MTPDRFTLESVQENASKKTPPRFGGAVDNPLHGHRREQIDPFFSKGPVPDDQPAVIFHHIRKTAGSAMKEILMRNLTGAGQLFHYAPRKDSDEELISRWYQELHSALRRKERNSLICVAGHSANYLMPVLHRPFKVFTLLREPVDRVLSRYFFFGIERKWTLKDQYSPDWPDEMRKAEFFNGQARALLAPHYDVTQLPMSAGPPPEADLWRARVFQILAEHYTVGIQERLGDSLRLFAREFGLKRLEARPIRVNPNRPAGFDLDLETYELILEGNWLDVEIYRQFARIFERAVNSTADDVLASPRRGFVVTGPASSSNDLEGVLKRVKRLGEQLHAEAVASQVRLSVLEQKLRMTGDSQVDLFISKRKTSGNAQKITIAESTSESEQTTDDDDVQTATPAKEVSP